MKRNNIIAAITVWSLIIVFVGVAAWGMAKLLEHLSFNQTFPSISNEDSSEVDSIASEKEEVDHLVFEVRFRETLLYNEHIGTDWKITYRNKGQEIKNGERFVVPDKGWGTYNFDTDTWSGLEYLVLEATATENDQDPDVGTVNLRLPLRDGASTSGTIVVKENSGSNQGKEASWSIHCKVSLVQ